MAQSFSLPPDRCIKTSAPALREEIQGYTGSVDATSKILSSIERFGIDPTILRYDIAPKANNRISRTDANAIAWTVSAVRLRPEPIDPVGAAS